MSASYNRSYPTPLRPANTLQEVRPTGVVFAVQGETLIAELRNRIACLSTRIERCLEHQRQWEEFLKTQPHGGAPQQWEEFQKMLPNSGPQEPYYATHADRLRHEQKRLAFIARHLIGTNTYEMTLGDLHALRLFEDGV